MRKKYYNASSDCLFFLKHLKMRSNKVTRTKLYQQSFNSLCL